jgi:phosphatidylglycerophosphate synthase
MAPSASADLNRVEPADGGFHRNPAPDSPALHAALLILPGAALEGTAVLLGLTLEERLTRAARKAGFQWVRRGGEALDVPSGPVRLVLVPADVVPQVSWLKALLALPAASERPLRAGAALVVDTERPAELAASPDVLAREATAVEDPPGSFVLRSRADLPAAERWLLSSLIKAEEGFMSRHVERKVSLAITRLLVRTSMTPNAMTLVSVAIGVAGAAFFLSERPSMELAGALLFLAHSILDGCDGELARLKFMQSPLGAILDYWGDNLVHVAVFGGIAVGWSLASGSRWPLVLGVLVGLAMLASAALMFRRTVADQVTTPGGAAADRLAGALANRDFIYLIILLAAFGKATWCLVIATIGAPAFLALVLWRDRIRRT